MEQEVGELDGPTFVLTMHQQLPSGRSSMMLHQTLVECLGPDGYAMPLPRSVTCIRQPGSRHSAEERKKERGEKNEGWRSTMWNNPLFEVAVDVVDFGSAHFRPSQRPAASLELLPAAAAASLELRTVSCLRQSYREVTHENESECAEQLRGRHLVATLGSLRPCGCELHSIRLRQSGLRLYMWPRLLLPIGQDWRSPRHADVAEDER